MLDVITSPARAPERAAQAVEVASHLRITMVVTAALSLLVYILLLGAVPERGLILWTASSLSVSAIRFAIARWQVQNAETRPDLVLHLALAGSLVGAVTWGLLPWFVSALEVSDPRAPLVMMILSGIAGGSLATSYSYKLIPIVFSATLLAPVIAVGIYKDVPGLPAFVTCVLLFVALIGRAAVRSEQSFLKHVRLAAEQSELTRSLEAATIEARESNRALDRLARHDTLTSQLNRRGFRDALEARLSDAAARRRSVTLMLLDLDGFKAINDNLGHPAGDAALVKANERILAALGDLDASVGRMGGDEFAIAIPETAGFDADAVAAAIVAAMAEPLDLRGERARFGCSIGIAVHPDDGGDIESLISHADLALYAAKDGGRGRARRFEIGLLSEVHLRRVIETDLAIALARRGLEVHFEPQISLRDGSVTGLEALLRWNHPLLGWIDPRAIVEAARRSQQKSDLMRYVLQEIQAADRTLGLHRRGIRIAVNVGADDLASATLSALLQEIGAGEALLEVQIDAESSIDLKAWGPELATLKRSGVRIAIDNFGSPRSTFMVLHDLPVDRIGLARGLGQDGERRPTSRPVMQAALVLGRTLGAETVAKGVTAADTVDWLRDLDCGAGQGPYFAPPMPIADLAVWMAERDRVKPLRVVA